MAKSSGQSPPQVKSTSRLGVLFRVTALSILTTIGCLALAAFTLSHWLENHILNTDAWVATVAPLPQTPVVNTALSGYITGLIFDNVNVEQEIQNVLPPKAAFIASPLADQLKSLTTQTTKRILQGNAFQTVWTGANRFAMNRLLTNARSPNPPGNSKRAEQFNLDLSGVKDKLSSRLGTTASALPALGPQSGQSFHIGANLQENRKRLWQYIRTADFLEVILPFVVSVAFLGALAITRDRRRTLLVIAVVSIVVLLIELIFIKAARQSVLDKVQHAQYRDAVGYIYDTITAALRSFVSWLLVPGVLIVLICIIAGPARWAASLRNYLTRSLAFLRALLRYWHDLRELTRRYKFFAWGGIGLLLLLWLAFISGVTASTVLKDVLIAVSLAELVYIVAYPRPVARL